VRKQELVANLLRPV